MKHTFEKLGSEHETAVMDIFNYYTQKTFAAYPEGLMPNFLFTKFLEIGREYPAYAIRHENGTVAGFCMLRPYNPFPSFRETAEVSYFIRHDLVRTGIGKSCLLKLEEEARSMGIRHLLADISSENPASIEFHKKNGFVQCGSFSNIGKKFGRNFSVVWLQKELL